MQNIKISWACPDIGEEEKKALEKCIESNWIGGNGPQVCKFEEEFAKTINVRYAIAVVNGTIALITALMALPTKVRKPAVPTFTFIATYNAPRFLGLHTTLVDCDKGTFNISPEDLESKEWDVVIPVHVAGLPASMHKITQLAEDREAYVIEDSAEAIGATYHGHPAGSFGQVSIFSFHATKVITCGEGGMVVTDSKEIADRCHEIVNQGYSSRVRKQPWDYLHRGFGLNFRMTEMQAAIGRVQLSKLKRYVRRRQMLVRLYKELLGEKVQYQLVPAGCVHPYFLFLILVNPNERDRTVRELNKKGIQTKVTWRPVHLQPAYREEETEFPNSEWIWKRVISLPIHNRMTEENVHYVSESVLKSLE